MNAFLGSLAVIIAALFISIAQIYKADTWAGMAFAVVLLWAAYGITRDALRILVDATPPDVDLERLRTALLDIPGVRDTHHLHVRTVTGQIRTFSGHLVIDDNASSAAVLQASKEIVDEQFDLALSTIQVEPPELAEHDPTALEYQRPAEQSAEPHADGDHSPG